MADHADQGEIDRLRAEAERLRHRLVLLSELSRRIASSLEVATVFQHVVDSACELTSARYGALGVFDGSGRILQFITHGVDAEERGRIGSLPEGRGILGLLQEGNEPIRLYDLTAHERSAGVPANHPRMTSFLGAPIRHGEESLGNLYLTEKAGGKQFTEEDESLLVLFAAQAAMAIRNAQLHARVQDLAVLEERERIGMDLHDGVIQSLYAAGLKLEGALDDLDREPAVVAPELQAAIVQLNQIITDIRSYIHNLRPAALDETDLATAIGGLLQELKVHSLVDVELAEERDACRGLSDEQAGEIFLVAREALTNVRKHAEPASVRARLRRHDGRCELTIADDGAGFDVNGPTSGSGLRNMRERVERLGGSIRICSTPDTGTELVVSVPTKQGD